MYICFLNVDYVLYVHYVTEGRQDTVVVIFFLYNHHVFVLDSGRLRPPRGKQSTW